MGVATLRTTRELMRLGNSPQRAWDVALWSGVTPQGSADSLERLHRVGLAEVIPSWRPGVARSFRVDWNCRLAGPLARLFAAERELFR